MSDNFIQRYTILREDYSDLFNCNDNGFCIYQTHIPDKTILHCHEFYEIEVITKGKCIQNMNGITRDVSGGTITLLTLSDFHEFTGVTETVEGYTIHFTESNISPQLLSLLSNTSGLSFCASQEIFDEISGECSRLLNSYLSLNSMRSILIHNILERIIILILQNINSDNTYCPTDMQAVIDYINRHFQDDISRKDIANILYLNENYLSTKFKNTFGVSIQKFINKKRIIYARNMLLSTNMPVNEISSNSGFNSVSQFYRAFKNEFGVSPHEYKQNPSGQ